MRVILWTLAALLVSVTANCNEKKIVCYFGSWSPYRHGNGKMDIDQINPHLCTHLVYQFVGVRSNGSIEVLDPQRDLSSYEPGGIHNGFDKFNRLRGVNPRVKTLVSIGGWSQGSKSFSKAVANIGTRAAFVDSIVKFTRKYGFDGFDLFWTYPNQNGGVEADKRNYNLLLKELKKRFDKEGLILSVAVVAVEFSARQSYIIPELVKYVDFVNLIAWDMHGPWNNKTGIIAPIYAGSWETGGERMLNVNASAYYWLSQGAPAEKLVLGLPLYGRSFTLDDPKNNGIGAPAHKAGIPGPYVGEAGLLGYNELCEAQLAGGWQFNMQEEQRVPYTVKDNQWVGYENPESLKEKAQLINELGLGGAMISSIETDDFRGICGEKYPMLKTLNRVLRNDTPFAITTITDDLYHA